MASKHESIKWQVITDWTKNKKGRLYCCNQGLAFPARKDQNGETVPSEFPLWFGPLKRNFKGFPDLFGFEIIKESFDYPVFGEKKYSLFTTVEVKTKDDQIRKDQIRVMTGLIQDFGVNCYIAKEEGESYRLYRFIPNEYIMGGCVKGWYRLEEVDL